MELFFLPLRVTGPTLLALCFGLMIGSFLNVVVHRLPIMWQREYDNYIAQETQKPLPHPDRYDLIWPRSACPHCGHKITAIENIPVVSYLALRGKCIECKAPISIRYPALELATGLLSAFLIWHFGSGIAGLATLGFIYILISITLLDAQTKLIPDDLNYTLLWAGLLLNINHTFCSLQDVVIGAAIGYCSLFAVAFIFEKILKKQGMGNGDFKLLAALGAWFGWMALPQIILMSSVAGLLGFAVSAVSGKKSTKAKSRLARFLAVAGLASLLYGREISVWFDHLITGG